jgi:hypothetical protein
MFIFAFEIDSTTQSNKNNFMRFLTSFGMTAWLNVLWGKGADKARTLSPLCPLSFVIPSEMKCSEESNPIPHEPQN